MMIRFIMKRYSCNLSGSYSLNVSDATIIDLPFPERVEEAMRDGYVLEDVFVTNEVTNIPPVYSNILQ